LPPSDLEGLPRILDGNNDGIARPDIGCHEYVNPLADTDGDGARDADEVLAGTDAGNSESYFSVSGCDFLGNELSLAWNTALGRMYGVQERTNLLVGSWMDVPGYTNLPGTGASMAYTNATENPQTFFRIRVWLP
jgi:hypothetical protein